jgi:protein gp37
MAENSKIEWTDATWNPLRGCSRVSEGCRNCYAEGVAARFSGPGQPYEGLAHRVKRPHGSSEARWTGKVALAESVLAAPLRWKKPRHIFVNSMSDLFHEDVPDEWIDRIFTVMALARQHTFQVLTKRPARMRDYATNGFGRLADTIIRFRREQGDNSVVGPLPHLDPGTRWWPLPNVWLGVSIEDQPTADERVPLLLDTMAAVRFISAEPLLAAVNLARTCILAAAPGSVRAGIHVNALTGRYVESGLEYHGDWDIDGPAPVGPGRRIDWVIVGGESGPNARPMHPDWARSLRDQCAEAGVAYFFKQWGEWLGGGPGRFAASDATALHGWGEDRFSARVGKAAAGRALDGRTHDEFPEVSSCPPPADAADAYGSTTTRQPSPPPQQGSGFDDSY